MGKDISKQQGGDQAVNVRLNSKRLWIFRGVCLLLPVLLLVMLEVMLRVAGFGYEADSIIKCKPQGQNAYCNNVKFGWRFFPRHIAREAPDFVFRKEKGKDTYRIFVLGESAAQGVPDTTYCFGRILELMLDSKYPGVNFEVITNAMVAINSHVVLEIAKDCAKHDPDIFVAYLGNNEVVGPYGAGTLFGNLSSSLKMIRFGIWFKATKTGQLLTELRDMMAAEDKIQKVWEGMKLPLEKQVRGDDDRLKIVYSHFKNNLRDILSQAVNANAKAIVCTVGGNLKDSPPFASQHRKDIAADMMAKWEDVYQQGIAKQDADDWVGAVEDYLECEKIDASFADLQFRLGKCYSQIGQFEKAKLHYILARDNDCLRYRSDSEIINVIRDVAKQMADKGVGFVDGEKVFADNSPNGITGEELFYEHVHLKLKGNYLLAKSVFEQMEKQLPGWVTEKISTDAVLPDELLCRKLLAYTDWDDFMIKEELLTKFFNKSPFTEQLYHQIMIKDAEQSIAEIKKQNQTEFMKRSLQGYEYAVGQRPGDMQLRWKYSQILEASKKTSGFSMRRLIDQYNLLIEKQPCNYKAYTSLANILIDISDYESAIVNLEKSLEIKPTSFATNELLAQSYHKKGQADKAVWYYTRAIKMVPTQMSAYKELVQVLSEQGQFDKAIKVCQEALAVVDSAQFRVLEAMVLEKQGKKDEAIDKLQDALKIYPDSQGLKEAYQRLKD